jgi:hypothetical protein
MKTTTNRSPESQCSDRDVTRAPPQTCTRRYRCTNCSIQSFLGSHLFLLEPAGSLPHSQEPVIRPLPNQMSPVDILRSYILKIHFNIIHLRLGLQSGLFL